MKEKIDTSFPERFAQLIEQKKLEKDPQGHRYTDIKIAKELKVTRMMLNNYCKGANSPTLDVIVRIVDYFHVSFNWLIGTTDDPSPTQALKEKDFGLNVSALSKLNQVKSGHATQRLNDFDPYVFGSTKRGVPQMYSGDELWRPLKLFPSNLTDIQKEEKFTELEFKTLNRMIEDWTIIDDITKCLYGEPFKVNNFMSLSDYYQLRVNRWILDQQHRIMMETYSNEKERVILDIKPTILEELRRQL